MTARSREGKQSIVQETVPLGNVLSERELMLYRKITDVLRETFPEQDWTATERKEPLIQNLARARVLKIAPYEAPEEPSDASAPALALKPEEWLNWADSIDLNLDIRGTSFPEIDGIQASVTYPVELINLQEEYYASIQHGRTFVKSIKDWITRDRTIAWDSNPHRPPFWDLLINEWSFAKDAVNAGDYEAAQCCLVNSMMMLIFSRSLEREHQFEVLTEKELALPRPRSGLPPRFKSCYAMSDIAVMKGLPHIIFRRTRDVLSDKSVLHCLKHYSLFPNKVLLGAFAVQARKLDDDTSPRLLAMSLSSMQYHRRALGLKDRPVYGAVVFRGVFQLYTSYWDDQNRLWCCKVRDAFWDLNSPVGFVKCLYFLRALRDHIAASFDDDLESFDIENLVNHLQRNPENWRTRPANRSVASRGGWASKKRKLDEDTCDDDLAEDEEDDCSDSSLDTPQQRLERIFDIVVTSHAKASRFAKWLRSQTPAENKDAA